MALHHHNLSQSKSGNGSQLALHSISQGVISHVLSVLGHVTEAAGGSEKVVVMGTTVWHCVALLFSEIVAGP